ncbi:MAG: YrdB family protein [Actinomycetota bacterium]
MSDEQAETRMAGAGPGRTVVLTVRFATELAMLAVLAVAAAHAAAPLAWRIVLAVAGPVLAAVIWGVFIGPKARRRLDDPLRLAVETVLVLVSAALLAWAGFAVPAGIFAVVTIAIAVLVRLTSPGS